MTANSKMNAKNSPEGSHMTANPVHAGAKGATLTMPKDTGVKAQNMSHGGKAAVNKAVPDTKITAKGSKSNSKKR
jgi:hypothetical protein